MKDGAVSHRPAEVGAEAAVGRHHELQAAQAPARVKACGVVVGKRVAFAGDHEVVVAVHAQLDGLAELARRQCRPHGHVAALRFFAAKAAAHAPAFHAHRVVVNAQRMRHPVLRLSRVLRAGVHQPLVLLLRQHVGDLPFQVKMFLPADFKTAADGVRRARQCGGGVTAAHGHGWQHKALRSQRFTHCQHGGQGVDVQLYFAGSVARLHHAVRHHQADNLADVLDRVHRKDGLVMHKGGQQRVAGHVGGQHHAAHTGHGQRGCSVHTQQAAVRHVRQDGRGKQRAFDFGNVVDVIDRAGHLRTRALMKMRLACGSLGVGRLQQQFVGGVHASASRLKDSRLMCCAPWLSSQKRCNKLPSTSRR